MTDPVTLSKAFDELRRGDSFSTDGRTVTEADIVGFAAQTGDSHPQHVDGVWSATSIFGERVAHGMLVLSYGIGLVPLDPSRVVALRRVADAVFARPVKAGDTIRAEGRVVSLTATSDAVGLATLRLRIVNQHDQLACRALFEFLWRRADRHGSKTKELPA